MTHDELKKLANEMGYNLIPKHQREKLKPCKCGANRRRRVFVYYGRYYKCLKCGFKSPYGQTEKEMRENWNKAVEVKDGSET